MAAYKVLYAAINTLRNELWLHIINYVQPQLGKMMSAIVGRDREIAKLMRYIKSHEPELIALYGRRRVGKTHLIRTSFQAHDLYFEFTGMRKASLQRQLSAFVEVISKALFNGLNLATPASWQEAFALLNGELQKYPEKKIILFFDELPWMVTPRSKFMQEFEHCWNTQWSQYKNLNIILCGSAASWMLDHVINAKGGLHNRITRRMLLKPFDLATTKDFLVSMGCKFTQQQITELYMVTGGVPYYLKQVSKTKSVTQNIQSLCFDENGILRDEFERLFKSLYEHADINLQIIRALAQKRYGMTRDAILQKTRLSTGGSFNKRLEELEAAGFIRCFIPYGKKSRNRYYQIIDEFSLFHLNWIEPLLRSGFSVVSGYWQTQKKTPAWQSWSGYAFESICLKHIEQLRSALDLQHTGVRPSSWQFIPKKGDKRQGTQIDLLFDRDDEAISLFEIKYADKPFVIDKAYAKNLSQKVDVFTEMNQIKKQLFLIMVAANGLKENMYSEDLIQQVITLDDLFKPQ